MGAVADSAQFLPLPIAWLGRGDEIYNERFGRLEALWPCSRLRLGVRWVCRCECGRFAIRLVSDLRQPGDHACAECNAEAYRGSFVARRRENHERFVEAYYHGNLWSDGALRSLTRQIQNEVEEKLGVAVDEDRDVDDGGGLQREPSTESQGSVTFWHHEIGQQLVENQKRRSEGWRMGCHGYWQHELVRGLQREPFDIDARMRANELRAIEVARKLREIEEAKKRVEERRAARRVKGLLARGPRKKQEPQRLTIIRPARQTVVYDAPRPPPLPQSAPAPVDTWEPPVGSPARIKRLVAASWLFADLIRAEHARAVAHGHAMHQFDWKNHENAVAHSWCAACAAPLHIEISLGGRMQVSGRSMTDPCNGPGAEARRASSP